MGTVNVLQLLLDKLILPSIILDGMSKGAEFRPEKITDADELRWRQGIQSEKWNQGGQTSNLLRICKALCSLS